MSTQLQSTSNTSPSKSRSMSNKSGLPEAVSQMNAKPLKPRKFRSPCDACSSSKVKCDQERPRCLRCIGQELHCNYSPSRRMGKPRTAPRKLISTCIASPFNASNAELGQEDLPPRKKRRTYPPVWMHSQQFPGPASNGVKHASSPSTMNTADLTTTKWQDALFEYSVANDTAPITGCFEQTPRPITGHSTSGNNSLTSIGTDSSEIQTHTPHAGFHFTSASPQPKLEPSPPSSGSGPTVLQHSFNGSNFAFPQSYMQVDTSVEETLGENGVQIEGLYNQLASSCPHDPQISVTLALICLKILSRYEKIMNPTQSFNAPLDGGDQGVNSEKQHRRIM
ncbi:hypothetical protein BKA61DRAFT_720697 [Leptodontidium sp. MPI-SDFR-AT-0119]|nr:hypothetical protein BKA61DRAFT_720697 [Leptodontidium sp. MPI-SDFR-AT-0119]